MGLFDGRDGATEDGSTAQMAKWLGAEVVLVMDCWAIARSAAAMVKGYQDFDAGLRMGGIVFNKVGGAAHTQWLREAIEAAGGDINVLGGVPKANPCVLVRLDLMLMKRAFSFAFGPSAALDAKYYMEYTVIQFD